MWIKALKTFIGNYSMKKGETRNCEDEERANDLIKVGLAERIEGESDAKRI